MYRNSLFSRGAKNITKFQLRTGNNPSPSLYNGRGMKCGAGMDEYLLSLISGISRMSAKPKRTATKRRSGAGLKFIR
ncbi:MAG: hypothetical protein ACOVNU_12585 [Candidatus Kapaibacteriota bacterium]